MQLHRQIVILITVITASGCSNKQVYQAIQDNRRQECEKLLPTQREECLQAYDTSYEEYERSRETR